MCNSTPPARAVWKAERAGTRLPHPTCFARLIKQRQIHPVCLSQDRKRDVSPLVWSYARQAPGEWGRIGATGTGDLRTPGVDGNRDREADGPPAAGERRRAQLWILPIRPRKRLFARNFVPGWNRICVPTAPNGEKTRTNLRSTRAALQAWPGTNGCTTGVGWACTGPKSMVAAVLRRWSKWFLPKRACAWERHQR